MWTLIAVALSALLWLVVVTVGPGMEGAPEAFGMSMLRLAAMSLSALAVAQLLQRLLRYALLSKKSDASSARSDLLRSVMNATVYLVVGVLFLRFGLGQDVTSVLATSALVTVIMGLALQPTLGHLFSGLSIEIERPLRVGDYVRHNELEGRVVALSWRTVSLETERGTTLIIPNAEFTSRSVEIIRASKPSRHQIVFFMGGDCPPNQVITLALAVLRSDLAGVVQTPSPSVVILGMDPVTGALRFGARFFTLQYLDRASVASLFMERLWYSLHRAGMALPQYPVLEWQAEEGGAQRLMKTPAAPRPHPNEQLLNLAMAQMAPVPAELRTSLLAHGRIVLYGPGECCGRGMAGFVLQGRLIEDRAPDAEQRARDLATLRAQVASTAATEAVRMDAKSLDLFVNKSARAIGPLAHSLCLRIAAWTDDLGLAHALLAESIHDDNRRNAFMADVPAQRMTRLDSGAWFGVPRMLELEEASHTCAAVQECAVFVVSEAALRQVLVAATQADANAFAAYLQGHAVGCKALSGAQLKAWTRAPHTAAA